jgi:hypothetical protein
MSVSISEFKHDVRLYFQLFVGGIMSYLRYIVCLCIVVSNTYCVVFFALFVFVFCLMYPNVASFSGMSILDCTFGFSNVYLINNDSKKKHNSIGLDHAKWDSINFDIAWLQMILTRFYFPFSLHFWQFIEFIKTHLDFYSLSVRYNIIAQSQCLALVNMT